MGVRCGGEGGVRCGGEGGEICLCGRRRPFWGSWNWNGVPEVKGSITHTHW